MQNKTAKRFVLTIRSLKVIQLLHLFRTRYFRSVVDPDYCQPKGDLGFRHSFSRSPASQTTF